MKFEMKGFDKLEKKLNKIQHNVNQINGNNEIPFKDLFNSTFMTRYTEFDTINSFFQNSSFTIESENDLEAIPSNELDTYVSNYTSFNSWKDMLNQASKEWISKQLEF